MFIQESVGLDLMKTKFLILLLCLSTSPLWAATTTVINLNDSGPGSLRDTIAGASSGDTIVFNQNLNGGTIPLASSLHVTNSITITAAALSDGITIQGSGTNRVFLLSTSTSSSTITLNTLTITGGDAGPNSGGGIYNFGQLVLENSTIMGNSAVTGGGLYTHTGTTLLIHDSTISGNYASNVGGGIQSLGGGVDLRNVTIANNQADSSAGGVNNNAGTFSIENSILTSNTGGGGFIDDVNGDLTALGNNIISVPPSGILTNPGNVFSAVASLEPLGDYGGPTPTMPPEQGLASH